MVKNYKDYIKEQHLDMDPFDEEDWEIDNLSPLLQSIRKVYGNKPYDEIIELDCSVNHLTSLEGIENLVNLERLYCFNNQLTSLEGVENLVNLKYLYCGYNQLTTLEGLENLANLKYLYCKKNRFSEDYKIYLKDYCKNKNISLSI
jgi:Leucine-rich repeat (LRR) protein